MNTFDELRKKRWAEIAHLFDRTEAAIKRGPGGISEAQVLLSRAISMQRRTEVDRLEQSVATMLNTARTETILTYCLPLLRAGHLNPLYTDYELVNQLKDNREKSDVQAGTDIH